MRARRVWAQEDANLGPSRRIRWRRKLRERGGSGGEVRAVWRSVLYEVSSSFDELKQREASKRRKFASERDCFWDKGLFQAQHRQTGAVELPRRTSGIYASYLARDEDDRPTS